jgi:hypothetical protein
VFAPDPLVDNGVVLHHVVVDHGCMTKGVQLIIAADPVAPDFGIVQALRRDKRPGIVAQTKTETDADVRAVVGESNARTVVGTRG